MSYRIILLILKLSVTHFVKIESISLSTIPSKSLLFSTFRPINPTYSPLLAISAVPIKTKPKLQEGYIHVTLGTSKYTCGINSAVTIWEIPLNICIAEDSDFFIMNLLSNTRDNITIETSTYYDSLCMKVRSYSTGVYSRKCSIRADNKYFFMFNYTVKPVDFNLLGYGLLIKRYTNSRCVNNTKTSEWYKVGSCMYDVMNSGYITVDKCTNGQNIQMNQFIDSNCQNRISSFTYGTTTSTCQFHTGGGGYEIAVCTGEDSINNDMTMIFIIIVLTVFFGAFLILFIGILVYYKIDLRDPKHYVLLRKSVRETIDRWRHKERNSIDLVATI